jgi:hypothetical protein
MDRRIACRSALPPIRLGLVRIAAAAAVGLAAIGCASQVPETIYIYPSVATSSPTEPPSLEPSPLATATATATAEATPTTGATAAPTSAPTAVSGATPTPFHPPTPTLLRPNLYFSHHDTPNVSCGVA